MVKFSKKMKIFGKLKKGDGTDKIKQALTQKQHEPRPITSDKWGVHH